MFKVYTSCTKIKLISLSSMYFYNKTKVYYTLYNIKMMLKIFIGMDQ